MTDDPKDWIGLHERLDTIALRQRLDAAGLGELAQWSKAISADEAASAVGAHLGRVLAEFSLALREADNDVWLRVMQDFARAVKQAGEPLSVLSGSIPVPPFRQLLEVLDANTKVIGSATTQRPDSPLAVSALLTGSGRSPSLVSQLQRELASADRTDWLVSFIKWSGIRPLRAALKRYTDTPNSDGSPRLRIATTSYLGATDIKAIEFLLDLPNTEVRVSYDTHRTRLHAKAYLFHRNTDFGSGYVGSANVSRAALDEGLEWTAKVAEHELPHLWRQLLAAFETHWEDPIEFERLSTEDLPRLRESLNCERVGKTVLDPSAGYTFFDLRPYGFQQEILDAINAERRSGLNRHLVVAATGTGKTMVAAFDYREVCREQIDQGRPTLLFIAHREEILRQSLDAFRHVLRDSEFGDLVFSGTTPFQDRHLFCTVQSWQSGGYAQADLKNLFGANEARAKWVLDQTREIVTDLGRSRGLGFCVSKEHARYMAERFSDWGLPSVALIADSPPEQRRTVQADLVQHRICFIFTVDLYNEGIDIPEVDTVLLLRPTESLVVYLQQLGRGLRLHQNKSHLTVIDFIAPQHRQFRYASRFRALSADPRKRIDEQVEQGFSWLPSGCLIDLDRQATERILANIRNHLGMRRPELVQTLAGLRQHHKKLPSLQTLLDWLHLDAPDDLLRHGLPCRLWQSAGGQDCSELQPFEKPLSTGLRRLAQATDTQMLQSLIAHLQSHHQLWVVA